MKQEGKSNEGRKKNFNKQVTFNLLGKTNKQTNKQVIKYIGKLKVIRKKNR
jgi:hypothetical protein